MPPRQYTQLLLTALSAVGWVSYLVGFGLLYNNLTEINALLPLFLGMSYRVIFVPFWLLAGATVLLYVLMVVHSLTLAHCHTPTRTKILEAALMCMGVVYMLAVSATMLVAVAMVSGDFFETYFKVPKKPVKIALAGCAVSLLFYWVAMVTRPLLEIKCWRGVRYQELEDGPSIN